MWKSFFALANNMSGFIADNPQSPLSYGWWHWLHLVPRVLYEKYFAAVVSVPLLANSRCQPPMVNNYVSRTYIPHCWGWNMMKGAQICSYLGQPKNVC
mmetsp:Transcript_2827/g.6335  ORF Transcript_2827/g.6335 Transcript_2827/m.6335 type:complete len:98 (+) Transcript_2827:585-878(+)